MLSTEPAAAAAEVPGPVLFQDDFNGPAGARPDQTKWDDYSVATYNPSAAFGQIKPGNNETLDGKGALVIPATPTAGSAIRTGGKFGFQYGVISARIKVPAESGYWPAFWTLNSPPDGSEQLPVGELDVMEQYTMWSNVYHAQAHSWTGKSATDYHSGDNRCPQPETADLSGRFNTFSAKIEPGKITYYFNDVQCGKAYVKNPARPWAFGPDVARPNWLILDLAVGGAGGQQAPASKPAQMLVDRVEVRALPSAGVASPSAGVASPSAGVARPGTGIVSGATYEVINECNGKIAEVPASHVHINDAPLKTGNDVNGNHQRWRIVDMGNGFHELMNAVSRRTANVKGGSPSNRGPVVQHTDSDAQNAQWRLVDLGGGTYQFIARHSGKALNVRGNSATAGAIIEQNAPNRQSCGQRWRLAQM